MAICVVVLAGYLFAGTAWSVEPAAPTMDVLLERTATFASKFLKDFSNVKCTELVTQEKLKKNGKKEYAEKASYDYLLMSQPNGGELTLVESRLPVASPKDKRNLPLLVTNGFSTLLLVFHPSYQAGFEYAPLDDEVVEGRRLARIHFRHIHGMRSTAALILREREYPLDLEGTAWLDPDTGRIARIRAELEGSMEDIGLRGLRCEVQYSRISFLDSHTDSWLPISATIEVETPRQHWRNIHRFTSYERFSTSVDSRIAGNP